MEAVPFYTLPSISAIAMKLIIIWYGRKTVRSANAWIWVFLCGLLSVNVFELILFLFPNNLESSAALYTLISYYISAVLASVAYLSVCLQLAGLMNKITHSCVITATATGIFVLIAPDAAIAGARSIGYSVTRIAGPYYWVIQIIILGCWLIGHGILVYTAFKYENWIRKRRAIALLLGSFPLAMAILIVMALMQIGMQVNATIIVSLTINILLGVLIYTEYESGLFSFLSYVPRTHENRLVWHAAKAAYEVGSHGLGGAVNAFEKALVADALKKCEGNKTGAANLLGVSRATLRRKLSDDMNG